MKASQATSLGGFQGFYSGSQLVNLPILTYRVYISALSPLNPPILGNFERFGSPRIGG